MLVKIKFLLCFLVISAIFLFSQKEALAVTITIDSFPPSISSDAFNVSVSIVGPNPGTNYLRIDLYKEGTTNYFSETWNGTSWYGGSDGKQYLPITIGPESTASATFQGRVGNPNLAEYPEPGSFKLRIRRYTSSGNPASKDQQTPVDVQITLSIPTPTPEPTNTPTPTPKSPTPTPTPKPPTSTPTSPPSPTLSPTLSPSLRAVGLTATLSGEVLGEEESSPEAFYPWEATQEAEEAQEATPSKRRILPFVFLGLGLTFLGAAAYWLWYTTKLRWPEQEGS